MAGTHFSGIPEKKLFKQYVNIVLITYCYFLSCTSLDAFRKATDNKYIPAPGDSVLIETKRGNFYKSVISDTTGENITTENNKIPKDYIVSITPRKVNDDSAIILITGTVAVVFVYALLSFFKDIKT